MIVFVSMYLWSIVGFFIHLAFIKNRSKKVIVELLLLYQLIFSVGMTCLLAFIGLTFIPEYIAEYTGWPASPFEQELGNVNLAFGILGFLCIKFRDHFWTSTILGFSIWILADAIHHISHIILYHNYTPGNIGINLITDTLIPLILLTLLYLRESMKYEVRSKYEV